MIYLRFVGIYIADIAEVVVVLPFGECQVIQDEDVPIVGHVEAFVPVWTDLRGNVPIFDR